MKFKWLIIVLVGLLLSVSFLVAQNSSNPTSELISPEVYVGIDVAYGDFNTIKELIDQVSSYTNLFVIGCTAITHNVTELEKTCQYLYEKNMSFIVYQSIPNGYTISRPNSSYITNFPLRNSSSPYPPSLFSSSAPFFYFNYTRPQNFTLVSNWTETAKIRWGENFLGLHYIDEPGGRQLDLAPEWVVVENATSYEDASRKFNFRVGNQSVEWFRNSYSNWTDISLFTSDYALYWFDYKAGFDVILSQFGWNYSRQLNIALCRGAATVQNREWGAIVTWEYTTPPYIESGEKLYQDLILAYNNGAKYIAVFDSDESYTQSILKEEHLNALKQFWQYIKENPPNTSPVSERIGFVLPKDYAYGFRGPDDKVWGLWPADDFSYNLSVKINNLLEQYDDKLDIIYDDGLQNSTPGYRQLIYP